MKSLTSLKILIAFLGLLPFASLAPAATSGVPGGVTLLSPADNASLINPQPQFTWSQTSPTSSWFHLRFQSDATNWMDQWVQGTNWSSTVTFSPGEHAWWVQGWNSAGLGPWSDPFHFTLPTNAPGLVSPLSPNQTIISNAWAQFTWTADPNAAWYHLYVLNSGSFSTNFLFLDQWYSLNESVVPGDTGNFSIVVGSTFSGAYHWWVQGWNSAGLGPWSRMGSFTVPNLTPGPVTLLYPSGAQSNTLHTIYTWTTQPNAGLYEFYLTRNGEGIADDWYEAAVDSFGPVTNNYSAYLWGHGGGTFQWWVRAWNPDGMGHWSAPLTYQVPAVIPGATTLISPYGTIFSGYPTFLWTPVAGATWYHIQIQQRQWNGSYFNSVDSWTMTNSYTGSLPIGTYKWAVQTYSEDGYGPWSATWPAAIAGY